jgi:hypothetical protein
VSSQSSGCGTIIAVVFVIFLASKCADSHRDTRLADEEDRQEEAETARQSADEAASEAVAGTTYEGQGAPYGCTDDCSGHDAGYRWGEEHDVTDSSDCGGNSRSFIEGCEAYAEAYQKARQTAIDDGSSDDEE